MTQTRAVAILVAVSILSASGCSRTLAVQKPVTLAAAQQVTQAAGKQVVKVQLVTPGRPAAQAEAHAGLLSIGDGNAFILRTPNEEPRRIPFQDTRSVFVNNRDKGLKHGFLAGAIPGALLGLVVGSAFDSMGSGSSNEGAITLTITGALLTGIVGGIVGAAVGHRTTFTF